MERRFVLFLATAFAVLLGYSALVRTLYPPKPQPVAAADKDRPKDAGEKKATEQPPVKKAEAKKEPAPRIKAAPEPDVSEQWVMLGSADAKQPYRMLVTLTNRGAAVARIELNSPRYCDIDNRSGFLGHLVMDDKRCDEGCPVELVGPGTPADEAGLKPGDVIKSLNGKPVFGRASLDAILAKTRPGQTVKLAVLRGKKEIELSPKLRRRPLEVVKPEGDDPLSMLLTLQQFDDAKIAHDEEEENGKAKDKAEVEARESHHRTAIGRELAGVKLRTATWRVVPSNEKDVARFRRRLPELGLEVTKTYRLVQVPDKSRKDGNFPAYHLEFEIEIRNIGNASHKVAYRLDGPNGLPTEGSWYASKVSRNWNGSGLRDFVISFGKNVPDMVSPSTIAEAKDLSVRPDSPPDRLLTYIGVDAQYFSAVLMPERPNPADVWFDELYPIRVGKVDPEHLNLVNASCRLVSVAEDLRPGGTMTHRFKLFAGPKKPTILENKEYRLGDLIYYGWPIFAAFAVPLTHLLHIFYAIVWNYGLAIILLTVLVRGVMFPLSLKQAAGAQKMQMLQPEIKKLQEKHKGNTEARAKAQQELFRKHNYNPLSGCLPIFIQLPIFMGLYRCLMIDIELRDAPLISHAIRWCSNLAAPDMLYHWESFMPAFINNGVGIFGLGPYFNILPILTIILFLWQQKKMMPAAVDEQAAMQQKMMQYMMIFMGLMFFKVASGLCIYFIASSLWGLAERRFLPKTNPPAGGPGGRRDPKSPSPLGDVETRAEAKARARQTRR